jgi:hypothetical protein
MLAYWNRGPARIIACSFHLVDEAAVGPRKGHRSRILSTTAGDLELRIPKLRTGSVFPSVLERRRRVDQALFAVVVETYLHGVSTRKVDDLVTALGADTGISKSEVSKICADLDQEVSAESLRTGYLTDRVTPATMALAGLIAQELRVRRTPRPTRRPMPADG